jgi:REP-associated tyrosine transposase
MTRIARIVLPGLPHHVTQRGNRGERIFFGDEDYALYRDWLAQSCRRFGVEVWAYCQMPNHVHLILTPSDTLGLGLALSRAHRLYAGFVNARARQTGHLFQGRFGSVAMDEDHLIAAARYVALNPVRARLVARAADWPHSSVRAHMLGEDDGLAQVRPILDRVARFADLIETDADDPAFMALRRSEAIGRPLGSETFIRGAEGLLGRTLAPGKRGPKPKTKLAAPQKGD